jgi:hypothetical protein
VINNTNKNEEIKLLRNISGCFYPSEMVAMVRRSAAPKTIFIPAVDMSAGMTSEKSGA